MGNNVRERRFPVDQNFEGWRLDHFLANRIGRISRSRAGEIARHGDVQVIPERKVKAGTRLHNGDVVILREHLPDEVVQDDQVRILHQDAALLVIDKPPGMLVHEAASVRLNTIQGYLDRAGFVGAEPAHRIDRETSGLLLCAATRAWVSPLREMFTTAHPQKVYRALVVDPEGTWTPGARRTIEIPLRLHTESALGLRMIEGDLSAVTHVHVLSEANGLADLEVRIETGRQHQIRAHLAMLGTPVAGDKLYTFDDDFFAALHDAPGDPELMGRLPFTRHMLHAWKIAFDHPASGEPVAFECDLPASWAQGSGESE